MSENKQADDSGSEAVVDQALDRMAAFDAQELAIEAAEVGGASPELPAFDDAKIEEIIAASLRASRAPAADAGREGAEREGAETVKDGAVDAAQTDAADGATAAEAAANTGPGYGRLLAWGGAAVAIAASVLLWRGVVHPTQTPTSPALTASSLPEVRLELGGTARTLGEVPPVRPYGAGDTFVLRLSFDTVPVEPPFAALLAEDADGVERPLPFLPHAEQASGTASVSFEGEIAKHLPPGTWTLRARLGYPPDCSATRADGCRSLETRIEVVAP